MSADGAPAAELTPRPDPGQTGFMHKLARLLSAPDAEATSPGAPRHWWSEPLRPDEALWRQGTADLRWAFAGPGTGSAGSR